MLGIMGADPRGPKELVGLWEGYRESEQSWTALLLDLHSRGLAYGPVLAMGDGALGLWKALRHVYGPHGQRWWVPTPAKGLDALPKALQPQAPQRLQTLWMAPDR